VTLHYFAGVNTAPLEADTAGQRVLVSYAGYLRSPSLWRRQRRLLESKHWRSVVLDSGAYSELTARKRGEIFIVPIQRYVDFVAEHGHLFHWVTNLDDIEGDTARSNANEDLLLAHTKVPIVPVYHEGEPLSQLKRCVERARANEDKLLAVGVQRPNGKIVPTRAVRFLTHLGHQLLILGALDVNIHAFGLTLYT
jgi:hypothetical protein